MNTPALLIGNVALVAAAAITSSAHAALVSISGGGIIHTSPPANIAVPDMVESFTVQGFDEITSLTLTSPLTVINPASGMPLLLPIGAVVNSHFVFFDPPGVQDIFSINDVTVTVDQPILGVIIDDVGMAGSHALLGRAGIVYPGPIDFYGLESDGTDTLLSGSDVYSVRFFATAASPGDHFRIITLPAPGAAALLSAGALITARRRRSPQVDSAPGATTFRGGVASMTFPTNSGHTARRLQVLPEGVHDGKEGVHAGVQGSGGGAGCP